MKKQILCISSLALLFLSAAPSTAKLQDVRQNEAIQEARERTVANASSRSREPVRHKCEDVPNALWIYYYKSKFDDKFFADPEKGITHAVAVGVDREVIPRVRLGFYYLHSDIDTRTFLDDGKSHLHDHMISPYMIMQLSNWLTASVYYAHSWYETDFLRNIGDPTPGSLVTSSTSGQRNATAFALRAFFSTDIMFGSFRLAHNYVASENKAFVESDGRVVPLMKEEYGNLSAQFRMGTTIFSNIYPFLEGGINYDTVSPHFPHKGKIVRRIKHGQSVGGGFRIRFNPGVSGGITYRRDTGHSSFENHSGQFDLRIIF